MRSSSWIERGVILGIHFGDSHISAAYLAEGKPVVLRELAPASNGRLRAAVGLGMNGELLTGEVAARHNVSRLGFIVEEVRRLMGTDSRITLGAEEFTPQEIAARLLRYLKEEAERHIGEPVTEVVITVPAYFNDRQRRATREAAQIAGLPCRRLINEPTAAALAYGLERQGVEERILVYNLNDTTLDVTVLELSEGLLDILSSTGNSLLGGKDFDDALTQSLRRQCLQETGIDLMATKSNESKLRRAARQAREDLRFVDSVDVALEFIGMMPNGDGVHFASTITRREFETLVGPCGGGERERPEAAGISIGWEEPRDAGRWHEGKSRGILPVPGELASLASLSQGGEAYRVRGGAARLTIHCPARSSRPSPERAQACTL